MIVNKSNKIST